MPRHIISVCISTTSTESTWILDTTIEELYLLRDGGINK